MKDIIKIMAFSALVSSCGGQGGDAASDVINVKLDVCKEQLTPLDVMDVGEWICIEAEGSGYVGRVKRVEEFDGDFYVLDDLEQKAVLVYDKNGNFKCRIGATGEGPGEYQSILNFAIDRKNRKVVILTHQYQLFMYDMDGSFVKSHMSLTDPISDIVYANGNIWVSTNFLSATESHLIYRFNGNLEQTGEWIGYANGDGGYGSMFNGNLQSVDNSIYYVDNLHGELYVSNSDMDSFDKIYSFSLPNPMLVEIYKDAMTFLEKQRDCDWLYQVSVFPENLLVAYIANAGLYVSIYDFNGKCHKKGEFMGLVPQGSLDESGNVVSAVSIDEYLGYWSKQNIVQPQATPPKMLIS